MAAAASRAPRATNGAVISLGSLLDGDVLREVGEHLAQLGGVLGAVELAAGLLRHLLRACRCRPAAAIGRPPKPPPAEATTAEALGVAAELLGGAGQSGRLLVSRTRS